MNNLATKPYQITRIPAFSDNYLWLVDNGQKALTVDPGDAAPIIAQLEEKNLTLEYILTTHHHPDHTGGVDELIERYQPIVVGPDSQYIPQVTRVVKDGEEIELLGLSLQVIAVPGHTLDHIAYFIDAPNPFGYPVLFSGDTLFAGGCGRVFEGTFQQMRGSLDKLKQLPDDTRIHCAHEYTQANINFALAVEPDNLSLQKRAEDVAVLRKAGIPTVPSELAIEKETNPFLRYDQAPIIQIAQQRENKKNLNEDDVFSSIRQWKDNF